MGDDIAVIEGAAAIVRSQGGRNEAAKSLANHLIDLGMDLDMPLDTATIPIHGCIHPTDTGHNA